MYWNFRLVRMADERWPEEVYVEMREVYYNEDNEPCAHSSTTLCGDNNEEIAEQLEKMRLALGKPVLEANEFVGTFKNLDEEEV